MKSLADRGARQGRLVIRRMHVPLRPGEVRIQTGKLGVEIDVALGNRPRSMDGKFATGAGLP